MKSSARVVARFKQFARELYHTVRPSVTLMAGIAKDVDDRLCICYVGAMPRAYRLGFPGQVLQQLDEEVELGSHWVWELRRVLKAHDCDFVMLESRPVLRRISLWLIGAVGEAPFLPFFVHCKIAVTDLPALLSRSTNLRKDVRKVEGRGFSLQLSNEPADYRTYLDDYYKPYMAFAHGAMAALFDYSFLCRENYADRREWELLQIMLDGQWVAGALMRKKKDMTFLLEVGVKNADESHVASGALVALYWLYLKRARILGYRQVSLMWSPPFLRNGVLLYKKKFHPKLECAPTSDLGILLVPFGRSDLCRKILQAQPMLQLDSGRLIALAYTEKAADMAAAQKQLTVLCRRFVGIADYRVHILEKLTAP